MARLLQPLPAGVRRLGVLPSAFNPVTVAHLAIGEAAIRSADLDAIVLALPATLPHKSFHGATFPDRRAMLEACCRQRDRFVPAIANGGLMHEIVREVGALAGPEVELFLICGRDAAERIASWEYGSGPSFPEQLERFRLLVASRAGVYRVPHELRERVQCFDIDDDLAEVSSSRLRQAKSAGGPWEQWAPPEVRSIIRRRGLYQSG